jgi:hypothetical protein
MDRTRRANCMAPRSPDLTPLDNFLLACVKDQVYSQRVNTLGALKAWLTAVAENVTKDILHHVWPEVNYGWYVCRMTDGAYCEVFCT